MRHAPLLRYVLASALFLTCLLPGVRSQNPGTECATTADIGGFLEDCVHACEDPGCSVYVSQMEGKTFFECTCGELPGPCCNLQYYEFGGGSGMATTGDCNFPCNIGGRCDLGQSSSGPGWAAVCTNS